MLYQHITYTPLSQSQHEWHDGARCRKDTEQTRWRQSVYDVITGIIAYDTVYSSERNWSRFLRNRGSNLKPVVKLRSYLSQTMKYEDRHHPSNIYDAPFAVACCCRRRSAIADFFTTHRSWNMHSSTTQHQLIVAKLYVYDSERLIPKFDK